MVAKVKVYKDNNYASISLREYVDEFCKEAPQGWFEDIDEYINAGLDISNDAEYKQYLKKMNLKWFDYEKVNILYRNLKKTGCGEILEDDVLRYLAHIYGLGYFERINYEIDIHNPNLDDWLKIKNVFKPNRDKIPEDEGYSLIDLVPFRNGMNAIRKELTFSSRW